MGDANSSFVEGNLAFVAEHLTPYGMEIFDVTTVESPVLLGRYPSTVPVRTVQVSENVAYLGTSDGLTTVDVSDPTAPALLGTRDLSSIITDLALSGDLVYAAAYQAGLVVLDVSTPAAPESVGVWDVSDRAIAVDLSGGLAFVAGNDSLRILDLSVPDDPTSVGAASLLGNNATDVIARDTLACATQGTRLLVFNVSQPANPLLAGSLTLPDRGLGMSVEGNLALIAMDNAGLGFVDISDPSDPVYAGNLHTGLDITNDRALDVFYHQGHAFVSYGNAGLHVFRTGNGSAVRTLGELDTPGFCEQAEVSNGFAYLALRSSGFQIVDVSDPADLSVVGTMDTPRSCYDVAVLDPRAYLADSDSGLHVVDLSNPASPTIESTLGFSSPLTSVEISGAHAFLSATGLGVVLLDLSNPGAPVPVDTLVTPGSAIRTAVAGSTVVAVVVSFGISVALVEDPGVLVPQADLDLGGAQDASISGDFVFVVGGDADLQVVNLADPENPALVGTRDTGLVPRSVRAEGNLLYMGVGGSGVQVWDISNPATPVLLGMATVPGFVRGVAVDDRHLYACQNNLGLAVLPLPCAAITGIVTDLPVALAPSLRLAPNPFRTATHIGFDLAFPGRITVSIHDVSGRMVHVLDHERFHAAGSHRMAWDGRDRLGRRVPAGVYLVRIFDSVAQRDLGTGRAVLLH